MSDLINKNRGYAILILFISPLIGLIFALKNLNRKGKHLILTLFGLLYGLTVSFKPGTDGASHSQSLSYYYGLGFEDFLNQLYLILIYNPNIELASDPYLHFLSAICGSIFQSPKLLFIIVGFVYGYVYGAALLNVIKFTNKNKIGIISIFLIILFVIHRSYENMQTIRSWTGMWVLFNGVFGYHSTKQNKYILLIFLAPFIHFMYLLILIPAALTVFIKYIPKKLIIFIFVVSFFSNINSGVLIQNNTNEFSSQRVKAYTRSSEEDTTFDPVLERLKTSNSSWYTRYGKTDSVYYGSLFFIIFLLIGGYYNSKTMTHVEYATLSTGILMASLANFGSFVYTFYSRTMANAAVYILAVMVLLALRGELKIKVNSHRFFLIVGIIVFVPKIVYFISTAFITTSLNIFLIPFVVLFDESINISLRDIIDLFL